MTTNPDADDLVLHYLQKLCLQQFLDMSETEDVAVQNPGEVWVRQGAWTRYEIPEVDLKTLEDFAVVAASRRQMEHGSHQPIFDTELPGGERLNVCAFPVVPLGSTSHTIRRHEDSVAPVDTIPQRYLTDGWNNYAERTGRDLSHLLELYRAADIVGFLNAAVVARQNIVLAGATGSSKTTLLKTIISAIDHSKRIVTVQDAQELAMLQPNVVRLQFKRDDLSERSIGPNILLQAALRMHPDLVFLGEMRGPEAWTFVHDVVPPHPGSFCTIHATTPKGAFQRIIGLCKATPAAASYTTRELAQIVASAVDIIIPLEQLQTREFKFNPVWFVGEAHERDKTAMELLEE